MAEHIKHHEHSKQHEKLVSPEHEAHAERLRQHAAEQAKKERSEVNLSKIRELAEQEAKAAHEHKPDQHHQRDNDMPIGTQQSLKNQAYDQTMRRVQRKLNKPARAFSKVAHNKTVNAISDAGAKTVARPSGILGGSIVSFLGSLGLLFSAKQYGFTYNYAAFMVLFIGGFAVGAILELLYWALIARRRTR